jgi:hypothetical protein
VKHSRKENPVSRPVLFVGATALTLFGVAMIIEAIRTQKTIDDSSGGYHYDPPVSLQA